MPTATLDYTTDTWDLSVDPYEFTAAHHYNAVSGTFAVTGVLDYVVGEGYAGIYQA